MPIANYMARQLIRGGSTRGIIFSQGLFVENRGHRPTYEAWRQGQLIQTCIDVTISRGDVTILNWGVDESYNASDHNTIRWEMPDSPPPIPLIRPWHQANWEVFTREMNKTTLDYPETFTEKKVGRMVSRLTAAINGALQQACPLREAKAGKSKAEWYTADLRRLAKKVRRQYLTARRTASHYERSKYKKIQKKYKLHCRRAKRKSWRAFLVATPDENKMAAVAKIIKG